jgi:ferredoxin
VRTTYFVSEEGLARLLESLDAPHVYAAIRRRGSPQFADLRAAPEADLALRDVRPSASPKAFLQPARERVAAYSVQGEAGAGPEPLAEPRAVAGLRGCDMKALEYLDKVFLEGDVADPFYAARRRSQFLITVDCEKIHDACFCTALGGKPYAESGFDLNLTPLGSGYLVEAGGDKGREALRAAGDLVREATEAEVVERARRRAEAVAALERRSEGLGVPEDLEARLKRWQESGRWAETCGACVECAACTFICPTCYCFYLYDQAAGGDAFERLRTWDSCVLGDYSRMAGPAGAKPNPRPRLRTRLANRFLHKYAFAPAQVGLLGCTGCGRCIEACLGKVDLRQILKELSGDESR